MTDVVLFHHLRGLTGGVRAFADELRADGHTVHTPDLFDGALPDSLEAGSALSRELGDEVDRRAEEALAGLSETLVYGGFSFGVMTAQRLAQTRPGALGALLYEACLPITGEWAIGPWPDDVAVQIHGKDKDEFFALEGDVDAAREIVAELGPDRAELFTYPGDEHLFTDNTLSTYDPEATAQVLTRTKAFLARLG